MTACGGCDVTWRFWSTDLRTGAVRRPLQPISATFSAALNAPGQGQISLATKDLRIRDVWPHLTGFGIETNAGDGRGWEPYWYGFIDKATPADNGTTALGVVGIDGYPGRRHLNETLSFQGAPQTEILASLAEWVRQTEGVPLHGVAGPTQVVRDRVYDWFNFSNVGELIQNLTEVIDGPDYELEHSLTANIIGQARSWSTDLVAVDRAGVDRGLVLQSDREASGYSLDVDGASHATHVFALGAGEEDEMIISTATDPRGIYPRFDATPAWKDVSVAATLSEHAGGYLMTNRDPVALPGLTLTGMTPHPNDIRPGDTVHVRTSFGAVSYHGPARVTEVAWTLDAGAPRRTLTMDPIGDAISSVMNQTPVDLCGSCRSGTRVEVSP